MKKVIVVLVVIAVFLAVAPVVMAQGEGGKGELPNLLTVISPSLQALIEALVAVLIPYSVYYVKRYLDEATRQVKQKLTAEQYIAVETVVRNMVYAAEQIYGQMDGERKKQYVLEHAQEVISRYGWDLDLVHLEALVESIVRQELKTGEVTILPARVR